MALAPKAGFLTIYFPHAEAKALSPTRRRFFYRDDHEWAGTTELFSLGVHPHSERMLDASTAKFREFSPCVFVAPHAAPVCVDAAPRLGFVHVEYCIVGQTTCIYVEDRIVSIR